MTLHSEQGLLPVRNISELYQAVRKNDRAMVPDSATTGSRANQAVSYDVMRVYIGITGLSGTGKDTVSAFLRSIASESCITSHNYKLSDEIKIELERRGKASESASRAVLIQLGNELRAKYGGGVLAERIVKRDGERSQFDGDRPILVTATGIRSPEEVQAFRTAWGSYFLLVAVEAPLETRELRMISRCQYCEDVSFLQEVEQADQAIGIDKCVQMANWHIQNDGSLGQLGSTIRAFFDECIKPCLQDTQPVGHEPFSGEIFVRASDTL